MSLPVLDKDSYQYSVSDWVLYAGQALREAGYLREDPTGQYDEEFAAGVAAFQADHGINEENQVGLQTWAALGVEESEAHEEAPVEAVAEDVQVGALSEDGHWRWDGTDWVAAQEQPAEDSVEVSFNDELDDPDTEEAPAPNVDDIDDIEALWRAEGGDR